MMTTFALIMFIAGHSFVLDTGLSEDDCARILLDAPHAPIACEAE